MEQRLKEVLTSIPLLDEDSDGLLQKEQSSVGRSVVVKKLITRANFKHWVVQTTMNTKSVYDALRECLFVGSAVASWPGQVLEVLGLRPDMRMEKLEIHVEFKQPFGPFPELLMGCRLGPKGAASGEAGVFKEASPKRLAKATKGYVPSPLVERVLFVTEKGKADVKLGNVRLSRNRKALVAPYGDSIFLVSSGSARALTPFRWSENAVANLELFHDYMAVDLLMAVHAEGRGFRARSLLPMGIAPARPLPQDKKAGVSPLSIRDLSLGAPSLTLRFQDSDPVLTALAERLSLVLRSKNIVLNLDGSTLAGDQRADLRMVRWRFPCSEASLALIHLVGYWSDLKEVKTDLLSDDMIAGLLSSKPELRLEFSLKLERLMLKRGLVFPMATVERWYDVDIALEGITIGVDGLPRLANAFWRSRP